MINEFKEIPKEKIVSIGFIPNDEFNALIKEIVNLNKKQLKKWKSFVFNEDGSKSKVIFDIEKDLFTSYNHIIKQNQLIFPVSCINDVKTSNNGFSCLGEAAKQIILNDAPPEKFRECIANNTTNNHYRRKYVSIPKKY